MTLDRLALARGSIERVAERRTDERWLASVWADPATRVVLVAAGQLLVTAERDGPALFLLPPPAAPEGERHLLGVDLQGRTYFAVRPPELPVYEGARPNGLREVGALLGDRDAALAVDAIALTNWHATHTHCPRCGAPTETAAAGHVRRCTRDGSEHYPRTDPAVIMAVVDGDGRILLGRQPSWPPRRFSCLAGFVEPGESLEQAVRREVREEAGVQVGSTTYLGSQPWPFPSSLMLGFIAHAESTTILFDDEELAEARWFTRAELATSLGAAEVGLPPPVSIARRMIEHWYGAALPDAEPWT